MYNEWNKIVHLDCVTGILENQIRKLINFYQIVFECSTMNADKPSTLMHLMKLSFHYITLHILHSLEPSISINQF